MASRALQLRHCTMRLHGFVRPQSNMPGPMSGYGTQTTRLGSRRVEAPWRKNGPRSQDQHFTTRGAIAAKSSASGWAIRAV